MRSKKHLKKEKQNAMKIPEWLFQESIENKPWKVYNPKHLQEKARVIYKLDDKTLNKELAIRMLNPFYIIDRALQVGFIITLDGHHCFHNFSRKTINPTYKEVGIETR